MHPICLQSMLACIEEIHFWLNKLLNVIKCRFESILLLCPSPLVCNTCGNFKLAPLQRWGLLHSKLMLMQCFSTRTGILRFIVWVIHIQVWLRAQIREVASEDDVGNHIWTANMICGSVGGLRMWSTTNWRLFDGHKLYRGLRRLPTRKKGPHHVSGCAESFLWLGPFECNPIILMLTSGASQHLFFPFPCLLFMQSFHSRWQSIISKMPVLFRPFPLAQRYALLQPPIWQWWSTCKYFLFLLNTKTQALNKLCSLQLHNLQLRVRARLGTLQFHFITISVGVEDQIHRSVPATFIIVIAHDLNVPFSTGLIVGLQYLLPHWQHHSEDSLRRLHPLFSKPSQHEHLQQPSGVVYWCGALSNKAEIFRSSILH